MPSIALGKYLVAATTTGLREIPEELQWPKRVINIRSMTVFFVQLLTINTT